MIMSPSTSQEGGDAAGDDRDAIGQCGAMADPPLLGTKEAEKQDVWERPPRCRDHSGHEEVEQTQSATGERDQRYEVVDMPGGDKQGAGAKELDVAPAHPALPPHQSRNQEDEAGNSETDQQVVLMDPNDDAQARHADGYPIWDGPRADVMQGCET